MISRMVLLLFLCVALTARAAPIETTGTGFFYNSKGDLFTNKHLVTNCVQDRIRVKTHLGWYRARVLAIDTQFDLAALTIDHPVAAFASFRMFGETNTVSIPNGVEDVFSAGFASPEKINLKLQYKWGEIQPWNDPNKFPYVHRMRMDAFPGIAGSPILDYAALLVGIAFASSLEPAPDYDNLKSVDYGDRWIFIYNNNALAIFANRFNLDYNAWGKWERKDPMFIAKHAKQITALIVCQ